MGKAVRADAGIRAGRFLPRPGRPFAAGSAHGLGAAEEPALPAALHAGCVPASDCREARGKRPIPGGRASSRAQTSRRIRARGDARPPGGGSFLAALLLRGGPVGQPVRHPELLCPAMAGALPHLHRADRRRLRLPPGSARLLRQLDRGVSGDAGDPDRSEVDHDRALPRGLLPALGDASTSGGGLRQLSKPLSPSATSRAPRC